MVTADVFVLSEKAVLPAVLPISLHPARLVVLIKPPVRGRAAGRGGKNGVVKDPRIHRRVLDDMLAFLLGRDCASTGCLFPL